MKYELSIATVRNGLTEVSDAQGFLRAVEAAVARGGRIVKWMQSSACHPQGQLATVMTAVFEFDDRQAT